MRRRINAFMIAFFLLIVAIIMGQFILMQLMDPTIVTQTDGFDVAFSGSADWRMEDVNVERLRASGMPAPRAGDTVTVTGRVPAFDAPAFPAIMFQARFSAVEVYLEDELLTSCEMEELQEGEIICSGIYMTDLPRDSAGRELTMIYHAGRDYAFYNIPGPRFGETDSLMRAYSYRRIVPFVFGIFLIIYGASLVIMMTVYVPYLQRFETQIVTGILCAVLGVWILTSTRATLFIAPSIHTMEWEYVSLYLIPPLLYLYLMGMPRPGSKLLFYLIAGVSSVLCLVFIGLHLTGIAHAARFELPFYVVAGVGTVLVCVYAVRLLREGRADTSEGVRMAGLVGISIMNVIQTIALFLAELFGLYRQMLIHDLFSIGAAFFVMTQMVDYFIFITGYYAKREENLTLSDIAYVDALTGLANRAEWDIRMKELADSDREYCIFSLDLNGLKEINDTAGHARGDKLLTDVALAIREAFREEDFFARIGGDEFVVIMEDASEYQAQTHLRYLERRLKDLDRKERDVNHSCAAGYAFKKEGASPHEVYMLADTRMYDMKARQKAAEVV